MQRDENRGHASALVALHILLMVFSLSGVASKLASTHPFLSVPFILYYGLMVVVLGVYAIGWQQVIKRLPLTTAYANRAVTVIWGIVWGAVLFHESVSVQKVLGAVIVLVGVALYAVADHAQQEGGDRS